MPFAEVGGGVPSPAGLRIRPGRRCRAPTTASSREPPRLDSCGRARATRGRTPPRATCACRRCTSCSPKATGCAVIQLVDGAVDEREIPLRIEVGEQPPGDLAHVLHVDVVVDDADDLRERHLPGAPESVREASAWWGYCFLIETRTRLWNAPSTGRFMSTISGKSIGGAARKSRSVALPSHASSMGGGPTSVAG
jgi:hypothetical protein